MPPRPSQVLSDHQIREALTPFSVSLEPDRIEKIRAFTSLLLRWNRSISLTTVTDPVEIVRRHFGESMYATKVLSVENCRLADVGTGAGFPGMALKICSPSLRLMLVESNKKKCTFLHEVVRTLELTDVEIVPERFESVRPAHLHLDIITSRAVGEFKQLLRWAAEALARRGHLALWVGFEDSTKISRDSSWTWQPAAKIPDSQRRFVLIGRPTRSSDRSSGADT